MLKITFKMLVFILFVFSISINSGGKLKGEANHTFYTYSKSSSTKITTLPEHKSQNFIYFKNTLKGESVQFFSEEKASALLNELNAVFIFEEGGADFYCKYFYSSKIDDYIVLNGRKVNVHVAYDDGLITVGTPMIFGSF